MCIRDSIDSVEGLGDFVEIEAIDTDGSISLAQLQQQCEAYMALFEINENHLLTHSYSDMMKR